MRKNLFYTILCLITVNLLLPINLFSDEKKLDLGHSYLISGKYNKAAKIFTKLIKEKPDYYQAYHGRGIAMYYQKKYAKAIKDYTKALKINPHLPNLLVARGLCYFQKGSYDRSIGDYKKAIKEDSQNTKAMNQLAWTLSVCPDLKYRDGKSALKWAQKSVKINAAPTYLDTLAAAYAETGDFKHAIDIQKRVVMLFIQNDKEDKLDVHLKRLKSYRAKKPWRENG